jgi:hypothetical protein
MIALYGKPVGFKGLRKARCPIQIQSDTYAVGSTKASRANFVLSDFRVAIKATGHDVLLKRVLTDCAKALQELPSIAQCWHRNSAAYLVDFAAPTARYPAKPVASAAGQTCHLKAKGDYHFFA